MTEVRAYLESKGLFPRNAPGDEVHVPCMFCGEVDGKRGRLYINTNPDAEIPGLHHCKLCDKRGSLVTIKKFYGDVNEEQEKEDTGHQRRAVLAEAASYYHQALSDHPAALLWLKHERGLSIETITKHQLGYADGGLFKHLRVLGHETEIIGATGLTRIGRESSRPEDFLNDHITIPYQVAGNVVMIRGRAFGDADEGRKYVTPTGQKTRLFNSDATWEAEEVVVTEGEFDCLVLEQHGIAAVACPGANVWQDAWDAYFNESKRVWIVFDRDEKETGAKGAEKVLSHLGAKARRVDLPLHEDGKSKNDITEYMVVGNHTRADFEALLRATKGLLLTVDDAITEHKSLQGMVGLKWGITQFDMLMDPGHLPSQLMVFLAKTSTGKTIFLLNLFQRICTVQPDAKILFVSLEQTRGDWWERARRIYRFYHPFATDADAAAFWRPRLWFDDRNRVTEEQLLSLLDDFQYETGQKPDLVAIDYLGYWARGFKGETYQRTGDAVMSLKAIAKERRLAVFTPHQVSRMTTHGAEPSLDSARDSGVVEETADFVIPLWRVDTTHGKGKDQQTGEMNMRLAKSRHGGAGHNEKMWFAPLSLAIVPDAEKDFAQLARNEFAYRDGFKNDWEQSLKRHESGAPANEADYMKVIKAWDAELYRRLKP